MSKTVLTPKDMFEKRNTSDVFNRLIILGLLRILNKQIKYTQVWRDEDGGIEEITVPFFYDFGGGTPTSERFIQDNYTFFSSDECTTIGIKKMDGNFDIIPCGRISLQSSSIEAGNITNRFVMGRFQKSVGDELRSYVSFLYSLPLTMNFHAEVRCDTLNTAWKIEQAYREYFYKNKTFHVNYKGTVVPVRVGFPESLGTEKAATYTIGQAGDAVDIKLTFDIVCETYQPVFDPYSERPAENVIKSFGNPDSQEMMNDPIIYVNGQPNYDMSHKKRYIHDGSIYIFNGDGTVTVISRQGLPGDNVNNTTRPNGVGTGSSGGYDPEQWVVDASGNRIGIDVQYDGGKDWQNGEGYFGTYNGQVVYVYTILEDELPFALKDAEYLDETLNYNPAWGLGIGLNGFRSEDILGYLKPMTNLYGKTLVSGQEILLEWKFMYNMGDLLSVDIVYFDEVYPNEPMIIDTIYNNNFFYWTIPEDFAQNLLIFDVVIPNDQGVKVMRQPILKMYPDNKTMIINDKNVYIVNKGFFITQETETDVIGQIAYEDSTGKIQQSEITIHLLNNMVNPEKPVSFEPFIYKGNMNSRRIRLHLYDHYDHSKTCCFTLNEEGKKDYVTVI